jgi:thiol-disulfide isomerase/thioredoxin
MALTPSNSIKLNFQAAPFSLLDPKTNKFLTLEDAKGINGTLIIFICNHCPYVIHIIDGIVSLAKDYAEKGIALIAINSNDVTNYPEDSPEKMIAFSEKHQFTFPYLYDETQEVAKAYDAACTPDFYLLDKNKNVVYRGRFDAARPGNALPVSGENMRIALDSMLAGKENIGDQFPSIGCNIKWK